MAEPISVLIVDDSALMRNLIAKIIEATPGLVVADKAMNGLFALQKIPRCNPDVIVLDLEMPEMNGIEFLKERRKLGIEIPVVILSSIAKRGAQITMEALALGAADFITKPSGSISTDIHTVAGELVRMLVAYGSQYQRIKGKEVPNYCFDMPERMFEIAVYGTPVKRIEPQKPAQPVRQPGNTEIIAIGISTGGPNALREVLPQIPGDIGVPLVVVQHMPPGFTEEFANSLNKICQLEVKEAKEGDILKPNRILIAPGDYHIAVEKKSLAGIVHINQDPPENGHRPSADVLFRSVANEYKNHAIGVIMTGMGKDGAKELGTIHKEGGITLGQDEQTSIVYGMPKVAFEMGHVQEQLPLNCIAQRIYQLAKEKRE